MTPTKAHVKEAEQASLAFHIAMTQLGIEAYQEAMDAWQSVPPTRTTGAAAQWLARAVKALLPRHRMARDLAFAFYRLNRALMTGSTIQLPGNAGTSTTLGQLREEFADAVEEFVPSGALDYNPRTGSKATPTDMRSTGSISSGFDAGKAQAAVDSVSKDRKDDDKKIKAEKIPGLTEAWVEEIERAAQEEAQEVLDAVGPKDMARRLDKGISDDEPVKLADKKRTTAHQEAGQRQAASTERIAMNGARGVLHEVGKADKRAKGYVRVSRTGTPCGFCAMLISRGFVLYGSRAAAEMNADGDEYHTNCHCYALPVYSEEHYNTSPEFALNREYHALWPKVTKGYGGRDALNAWRRYFYAQRKQEEAAQAAAA